MFISGICVWLLVWGWIDIKHKNLEVWSRSILAFPDMCSSGEGGGGVFDRLIGI